VESARRRSGFTALALTPVVLSMLLLAAHFLRHRRIELILHRDPAAHGEPREDLLSFAIPPISLGDLGGGGDPENPEEPAPEE